MAAQAGDLAAHDNFGGEYECAVVDLPEPDVRMAKDCLDDTAQVREFHGMRRFLEPRRWDMRAAQHQCQCLRLGRAHSRVRRRSKNGPRFEEPKRLGTLSQV